MSQYRKMKMLVICIIPLSMGIFMGVVFGEHPVKNDGAQTITPTVPTTPGSNVERRLIPRDVDAMAPIWAKQVQHIIDGQLIALSNKETIAGLATFTKNYYEALKEKGFTDEQASEIVAGVGIPSLLPIN